LWQRWGIPLAINAGDALFSISQLNMLGLRDNLDPYSAVKASLMFNKVCLHLTCGQHMDISFESERTVSETDYLMMVRGKTAALIGFAAWLGGVAANQDDKTLNTLYAFGENLGLAFQMQDDLLGIWGDPDVTGKSAASDLLNKKKTLPILHGLAHSSEFESLWKEATPDLRQISRMADLLESCGSKEIVIKQAKYFTDKAFTNLHGLFSKQTDYTNAIFELANKLLQREF
jgi:geranylgeranyl diphosphate synthase type I